MPNVFRKLSWFLPLFLFFGLLLGACSGLENSSTPAATIELSQSQPTSRTIQQTTPAEAKTVAQPVAANSNQPGPITESEQVAALVERANPAVVTIYNKVELRSRGGLRTTSQIQGVGSGFIVSKDGYIVTNNHVVEGQDSLEVVLSTGADESDSVPARLIGADPQTDMAVVKIDQAVPAVLSFGDSSKLKPGQSVIAIGSALGEYRNSVTKGIISGLNRSVGSELAMEGLIQTDTPINSGNSGGPLISLNGEVIGINTAVVRGSSNSTESANAEALGFAIPSNFAKNITDRLIKDGKVNRPYLGISPIVITSQLAAANDLPVNYGVYINQIFRNTPAQKAGLQQGDIIVTIDGKKLDSKNRLALVLLNYKAGDTVSVGVKRNNQDLTVQLTLEAAPATP